MTGDLPGHDDDPTLVSDAEREAAAAELARHPEQGRLFIEEYQERLDGAYAARTRGGSRRYPAAPPAGGSSCSSSEVSGPIGRLGPLPGRLDHSDRRVRRDLGGQRTPRILLAGMGDVGERRRRAPALCARRPKTPGSQHVEPRSTSRRTGTASWRTSPSSVGNIWAARGDLTSVHPEHSGSLGFFRCATHAIEIVVLSFMASVSHQQKSDRQDWVPRERFVQLP